MDDSGTRWPMRGIFARALTHGNAARAPLDQAA
jgi:hypothetical protein